MYNTGQVTNIPETRFNFDVKKNSTISTDHFRLFFKQSSKVGIKIHFLENIEQITNLSFQTLRVIDIYV